MRPTLRLGLAALVVACAAQALPALAGPTLDRIRASGIVQMGYRDDAAPFSYKDRDGRVRGYSVELCEKAAAEIGRAAGANAIKVEWRPLSATRRSTRSASDAPVRSFCSIMSAAPPATSTSAFFRW